MTLTFGRKAFFGTFPMKNGSLGWWSNYTSPNPLPQSQLRDTTDVISIALSKHHHFPATEMIQQSCVLIKTNIFDIQSLPSWHTNGRVLLIGDAAHAVSPNSGQGLSLAVEDSSLLALLLSRTEYTPQEVFVKFEGTRKARVEGIIAAGRKQKDNKVEVGVVGGWIRNFILWVVMGVFALLGSLERMVGWQYRYRIDWDTEDVGECITTYKK
jgi:2-polyprenyl-6-methoxyphenol hydroxylase-like FAD-dependent oxidoreductase